MFVSRLFGGSILGEGTYGCVLNHPLSSKNRKPHPTNDPNNLTKIAKGNGLETEIIASEILHLKVKEHSRYFGLLKGKQYLLDKDALRDKNVPECNIVQRYGIQDLHAARMTYAGTPIESFNFKPATFNIYTFITNLIEAGALLTLHGIIHRDIHRGNILLDKNGIPRLIDFGLALFKQKKYQIDTFLFGFDPKYNQEPPEYSLWNAVEDSKSMFYMKKSFKNVIQDIVDGKPIVAASRVITKKTRNDQLEDLDDYINQSKSFIDRDFSKWWETYWSKVDAWGIGTIIAGLITKLQAFPAFYTNQHYTAHKDKIHQVVRALLELDPRKRVDLVEALHMINPNSYILKKYGRDWLKTRLDQKVQGAPGQR